MPTPSRTRRQSRRDLRIERAAQAFTTATLATQRRMLERQESTATEVRASHVPAIYISALALVLAAMPSFGRESASAATQDLVLTVAAAAIFVVLMTVGMLVLERHRMSEASEIAALYRLLYDDSPAPRRFRWGRR